MKIFQASSLISRSKNRNTSSLSVFFLLAIFCVVPFPGHYHASAALAASQDEKILFAGDSDIEYWKKTKILYPNSVNKGDGGTTCKQWVNRIEKWLDEYQPDTVVLVCGENDLNNSKNSAENTFQNFRKIVEKITTTGSSRRVIYMGTKPEPATKGLHAQYRKYDSLIRNYYDAEQQQDDNSRFVMIDVYSSFDALGNPTSLYARDKLHLSKDGYGYWNLWLQSALADDNSDCLRWDNGVCVLTSSDNDNNDNENENDESPTPEPSSTSSSTSTCADDPDFRFKNKKNDCEWVGKKAGKRCDKRYKGYELFQWCPVSCGDC